MEIENQLKLFTINGNFIFEIKDKNPGGLLHSQEFDEIMNIDIPKKKNNLNITRFSIIKDYHKSLVNNTQVIRQEEDVKNIINRLVNESMIRPIYNNDESRIYLDNKNEGLIIRNQKENVDNLDIIELENQNLDEDEEMAVEEN